MEYLKNTQLQLAFDFIQYTHKNIFLTGNAGTGKTTFLHKLKKDTFKRMVVVAPTGVAAINAGGVTIHSFFQMPFGPNIPLELNDTSNFNEKQTSRIRTNLHKFNREKIRIIKSLDLLVIDEISMLRADLLDGIDEVLRRFKNRYKPFGGVQLLMIGDMHQLAPVVKEDEWQILKTHYETVFFFSSKALKETSYVAIELKYIFRQSDEKFINLLGKVRQNKLDKTSFDELNDSYKPGFENEEHDGYIILTTHNAKAKTINEKRLAKVTLQSRTFIAETDGDFPEYTYPTEYELELKIGAQVMFVKNDIKASKEYYNGKIGKITGFEEESVFVKCPEDEDPIEVNKLSWENIRYEINEETKEIQETVVGKFVQYPLKLAWAITIHKSQGLTFDKAIIDAQAAFAFGQVYVALSRCRTLEGMVLSSRISASSIKSDPHIFSFSNNVKKNPPGEETLASSKQEFQDMLLAELFDFSQIQKRFYYLMKILKEHAENINSDIISLCQEVSIKLKPEIIDIAQKFNPQLKSLAAQAIPVEKNHKLQERIKKAAKYFYDKSDQLLMPALKSMNVDSDNKKVKKTIKEAITRLKEDVFIKSECLNACFEGFETKKYLSVRAKASIEKADKIIASKKSKDMTYNPIQHPVLYERLKKWRNDLANEENVPIYFILPQKTLNALANNIPASVMELRDVKGLGNQKLKKFGKVIYDIIAEYRKEKNMETADWFEYIEEKKDISAKIPSRQQTFEMFRSGKKPIDIAKERNMAISTIEGHLASYISDGELRIEQFVDSDKIEMISTYVHKTGIYSLSHVKYALGEKVSWSELKFVLNHLEKVRNKQQ